MQVVFFWSCRKTLVTGGTGTVLSHVWFREALGRVTLSSETPQPGSAFGEPCGNLRIPPAARGRGSSTGPEPSAPLPSRAAGSPAERARFANRPSRLTLPSFELGTGL